jgi:hypothetical protein
MEMALTVTELPRTINHCQMYSSYARGDGSGTVPSLIPLAMTQWSFRMSTGYCVLDILHPIFAATNHGRKTPFLSGADSIPCVSLGTDARVGYGPPQFLLLILHTIPTVNFLSQTVAVVPVAAFTERIPPSARNCFACISWVDTAEYKSLCSTPTACYSAVQVATFRCRQSPGGVARVCLSLSCEEGA